MIVNLRSIWTKCQTQIIDFGLFLETCISVNVKMSFDTKMSCQRLDLTSEPVLFSAQVKVHKNDEDEHLRLHTKLPTAYS